VTGSIPPLPVERLLEEELLRNAQRASGLERVAFLEVTGVVVNEKLQPARTWRKRTRARLHKLGLAYRLTRRDLAYLHGVVGMSDQFPESVQMQKLAFEASSLLAAKSKTVIGFGTHPMLPNGLTIRQAEALAGLAPRRTNAEIAARLGTTEAAVKSDCKKHFGRLRPLIGALRNAGRMSIYDHT